MIIDMMNISKHCNNNAGFVLMLVMNKFQFGSNTKIDPIVKPIIE